MRAIQGGVELEIKVVPGASRTEICGWLGSALKVRVTSPPEAGRANEAVAKVLAAALGVSRKNIHLVNGAVSPRKVFRIMGVDVDRVRAVVGD